MYAQYDKLTGIITGTTSHMVSDDSLEQGRAQIEVGDGVDGLSHRINLETLQVEEIVRLETVSLGGEG